MICLPTKLLANARRCLMRLNYYIKAIRLRSCHKREAVRLSIVIPCYNAEKTLARALRSVIRQETNFTFKIFVADDKSTDGTARIISQFVKDYPGIIVPIFRDKNMGLPHNHYDVLIRYVKTEYFCVLDADDYYTDVAKLQQQVTSLDNAPSCTYSSHSVKVDRADGTHFWPSKRPTRKYARYFYTHTSSKLYRSTILDFLRDKNPTLVVDTLLGHVASYLGANYYIDSNMSVYDYSGTGIWSSLTESAQNKRNDFIFNLIHHYSHGYFEVSRERIDRSLLNDNEALRTKVPYDIY